MESQGPVRRSFLWWIAGADEEILAECPRGDQVFIQHLGISLIGTFVFVFVITGISIRIAFPDLADSLVGALLASTLAFLIAAMVFLVDRLFIQSDWDWQAAKQRRELARIWCEQRAVRKGTSSVKWSELRWGRRAGRFIGRLAVISFRILLSLAIGLTIASFLELVIYKNEIKSIIHERDYATNRTIYDQISQYSNQLDGEIEKARHERDRLAGLKAQAEAEVNKVDLAPPIARYVPSTADIDRQIAALRANVAVEDANSTRYAADMVAELRGTKLHSENSGIAGPGKKYETAKELKEVSDMAVASYQARITSLEADRKRHLATAAAGYENTLNQSKARASAIHKHLTDISDAFSQAQDRLSRLERTRQASIEEFVTHLQKEPSFVPISLGVASQFRALRTLYARNGSTFEMVMIKLLIIMLEMTPVLQKVFFSPATLYAVKLDAARRKGAYERFNEEMRLRQELTGGKLGVLIGEAFDEEEIRQRRTGEVTPIFESGQISTVPANGG